ncbi:zinc transporter ZIP5 [Protopterus annectens]|uniref:zinc transporter ZIP5 n=1 Tax=Protopterus annectens TaxID=7888 RepID=UPI001CFB8EA5|nr:zinc transporter ZIP5 [Protopterus annectens]
MTLMKLCFHLCVLNAVLLDHSCVCLSKAKHSGTRKILSYLPKSNKTLNSDGNLLDDALTEQGYYLQKLFTVYGENGTLSYEGLTSLLMNLGLGKTQVVAISHKGLGHDHVSHLEALDVQESRHSHLHSILDHVSPSTTKEGSLRTFPQGITTAKPVVSVELNATSRKPKKVQTKQKVQIWTVLKDATTSSQLPSKNGSYYSRSEEGLRILEKVFTLNHSLKNHLHGDCLNVSQLLMNFGLDEVSEITPEEFTLICPALLYQIDSRVCLRHPDEIQEKFVDTPSSTVPAWVWGLLAITLISLPSVIAIIIVPFLKQEFFHSLLAFLVAMAVGTLCGDALLHLLPHASASHDDYSRSTAISDIADSVLKGLSVLGGIYLLFVIESIMTMIRKRHVNVRYHHTEASHGAVTEAECGTELYQLPPRQEPTALSFSVLQEEQEALNLCQRRDTDLTPARTQDEGETGYRCRSEKSLHSPSSHSHDMDITKDTSIANIAWMVIMGDGIHNFTDGLAIGVAFAEGIASGLSTTIAVFCHEVPHELGDFALLLKKGIPVKRVLMFNLLSALLGYLGMLVGTAISQRSFSVTPWIFAITAGIFLYVALADMLPDILQGDSRDGARGHLKYFILQNLGFLMGGAIMLCIAAFEDQIFLRLSF